MTTRFPTYRDDPAMAEVTTRLRHQQRRLRAALRNLDPTHSGYARDLLHMIRFERRRPPLQRSRALTGPNWHGPAIDDQCTAAAIGGQRHVGQ